MSMDWESMGLESGAGALEHGRRRITISVQGRVNKKTADDIGEGTGKTHFALTAPGPIALFATEASWKRPARHLNISDDMLGVLDFSDIGREGTSQEYKDCLKEFRSAFNRCLEDEVRTIVIDNASDLWELIRLSEIGALSGEMPKNYERANGVMRASLLKAASSETNLVLVHRVKEEYKGQLPTGRYKRAGFKHVGHACSGAIDVWFDGKNWRSSILSCGEDPTLVGLNIPDLEYAEAMREAGQEVEEQVLDFATVACILEPSSKREDWV